MRSTRPSSACPSKPSAVMTEDKEWRGPVRVAPPGPGGIWDDGTPSRGVPPMPKYAYDRLSAQDNSFLLWERGNVRMHVASTLVCDAGPLRKSNGGIDVELFKRATESYLHLVPRYRQRLHGIPLFDHSVWVDDPHFDIDYHIRHTALPRPGTSDQLKKLSARIMAQPLDRKRPLWETWIVEG